jgi:hypothetical protein
MIRHGFAQRSETIVSALAVLTRCVTTRTPDALHAVSATSS